MPLLNVIFGEYSCVLPLTEKEYKIKKAAAVKGHMLFLAIVKFFLKISKFWQGPTLCLRSKKIN